VLRSLKHVHKTAAVGAVLGLGPSPDPGQGAGVELGGGYLGAYASIECKLSGLLAAEGARLDASYTCPHAVGRCDCRKPLPGLLIHAANELGLSLPDPYFIGDSITDAEAGTAAGVTTILISSGATLNVSCQATYVVGNVAKAVEVILNATCDRHPAPSN
jgi:histidinol phosphatase-like enzyme